MEENNQGTLTEKGKLSTVDLLFTATHFIKRITIF
jgi:hypothetical protein